MIPIYPIFSLQDINIPENRQMCDTEYLKFRKNWILYTRWGDISLHVYRSGDKLQQHGEATHRSDKSLRVYWRILSKPLSPQQNFVAVTSRKKSNRTEFVRLVAVTKFCCGDKDFHKYSPLHTKRFVAVTCRRVPWKIPEKELRILMWMTSSSENPLWFQFFRHR